MNKRMEIFAVGKWNGMEFNIADLNGIVDAFNSLGGNHKIPLKIGHNKLQPMTDGQPAIGWVKSLFVEGNKLMADVTDVPDIVMNAMNKKLYRNVSVELDMDVTYKDTHFPIVLSGIALLGADIPAVNTLKDLTHLLSRDADFSIGRQEMFSAIAGNVKGVNKMELDALVAQVAALSSKVETLTAAKTTADAINVAQAAEIAQFKASVIATETAAKKAKTDTKRGEVNAIFEEGVKAELITPAQRTQFSKLLRIEDDAAIETIILDDVKALISGGKKFEFGRSQGKQEKSDNDKGETDLRPDEIVFHRCQELVDKKEAPDLMTAQVIVFRRDPELAKAYVHSNGRKQA